MVSMTTAQRDLLQLLLTIERPIGAAALGAQLHLTPRQVQYGLRDVKAWLGRRHVALRHLPGVGIQVLCPPDQRHRLLADLAGQSRFQLVLSTDQRQQLLALILLAAAEPLTLQQLQNDFVIARTTVLKDLDAIGPWLEAFNLPIARRQHRGCWIAGDERAKRQALAALLWGDLPFGQPIMAVRPTGLAFALAQDAALLPIVARASLLIEQWNLAAAYDLVAEAEAELGARFADEAVAPLALAVAIQVQRARAGYLVAWDPEALGWVQG